MGIRSILAKPFASLIARQQKEWSMNAGEYQQRMFENLVNKASATSFGRDHGFTDIKTHSEFRSAVPVRDYEALSGYVDRVVDGEKDVLWPGKPKYLAKTSGTTSGVKYIPITSDSIPNHFNSARNALMSYIHETGKSSWLDKKLIFLSGSPEMVVQNGIHVGRLSGIVNHHVPAYLRTNQMPSYATNCMEDWEAKVDRIVDETLQEPMSMISGIPPWVQMYFDKIIERTGSPIKDVFPDFSVFVYGGVNFEPYRAKLFDSIGKHIDSVETYPASEGFIAYQDSQVEEGLLLLVNSGIFFEFIPADQFFEENPPRLTIEEIEVGVNYVIILSTNAGLWAYNIGDTVKFVSRDPYRLIVTGRIKHFISAFGEHVIGEEVEKAMKETSAKHPEVELIEFTVAPNVSPTEGLPLHEWYVEFATPPSNPEKFARDLDEAMVRLNTYYDDLITGNVLRPLEVISLKKNSFIDYMKSMGKLGGQNKVPRLSNDRKIADALMNFKI